MRKFIILTMLCSIVISVPIYSDARIQKARDTVRFGSNKGEKIYTYNELTHQKMDKQTAVLNNLIKNQNEMIKLLQEQLKQSKIQQNINKKAIIAILKELRAKRKVQ